MTMTTQEAVQTGADLMGAAEQGLKDAHAALLGLPDVFLAIRANGDLESGLETMALQARARQVAGYIADVEAFVVEFHRDLTTRAGELGIDLPDIAARGATPLSGGR